MKRRIGFLVASALVAAVGFVAPPASAHTDACAGAGDATLGAGLSTPVAVSPTGHVAPVTTTFTFNLNTGACASLGTLSASGTLTGYCGQSGGQGTSNSGHGFVYVSAGTVLVVTGEVNGVVHAVEDPFDSGSCTNGTATHFVVNGAAALKHCAAASSGGVLMGALLFSVHAWACA